MWLVWLVAVSSAALAALAVAAQRQALTAAPRGWQLLAWSGIPLVLGGFVFIVRFWEPTPGPYLANTTYPLGAYVNTWAVSFGFMWLAFGLVFYSLALQAPRTWRVWGLLLLAWALAWLPHGIIGVGFAVAGSNRPSLELYQGWASRWPGLLQLSASAFLMLAHFGLAVAGFAASGRGLRRVAASGVSA